MQTRYMVLLGLFTVLASGCAITVGPADDGFALSQESTDIGKLLGDDILSLEVDKPGDKTTEQ